MTPPPKNILQMPVSSVREIEVGQTVDVKATNFEDRLIITEAALGAEIGRYVRDCLVIANETDCDVVLRHNGRRGIAHPGSMSEPLINRMMSTGDRS